MMENQLGALSKVWRTIHHGKQYSLNSFFFAELLLLPDDLQQECPDYLLTVEFFSGPPGGVPWRWGSVCR